MTGDPIQTTAHHTTKDKTYHHTLPGYGTNSELFNQIMFATGGLKDAFLDKHCLPQEWEACKAFQLK